MKPYDLVGMYIYPNDGESNENLDVYITEPGEEYYIHMFVWRVMPFHFKLEHQTESVDLALKKIVSNSEKDCDASDNYDYIGNFYPSVFAAKLVYFFALNKNTSIINV